MQDHGEFRFALLTSGGQCPRWMWEPLRDAATERRVTIAVIADISGLPKAYHPWAIQWYERWERGRYLKADGLLDSVEVAAICSQPILRLDVQHIDQLPAELARYGVDVLLVSCNTGEISLATAGVRVWSFEFGSSERQHREPGLWEVVNRSISTISLVETSLHSRSPQLLETIVGRTDPRSWMRNQLGLAAKASNLLRRWIPPRTIRPESPRMDHNANGCGAGGSTWESSWAVLTLLGRFGKHAAEVATCFGQWQLAVAKSGAFGRLSEPEILTPPLDRSWCDPFPLVRDGVMHIFLEECPYESGKGHIAMLSRSAAGNWSTARIVLARPYHLSYPFVFEYESDLFMLPETIAAGRVELYRCSRFPDEWDLDTVLLENFAGADATLWFQDERWWMFVDAKDELHVHYSDSLRGPWHAHLRNPVKSDSRSSRPAGRLFRHGLDVIRPAQDCSVQYGREVVFNKIVRLTPCEFEEVEIGRLKTPWNNHTGCHTFNQLDALTVVDRFVQRVTH